MSIVLVASEALRKRDTVARRVPALVSFLFGLVHGLGFAGALKSIGLPQRHLPLALLSFNVGVEIGQLLMVLAVYLLVSAPELPDLKGGAYRGPGPGGTHVVVETPEFPSNGPAGVTPGVTPSLAGPGIPFDSGSMVAGWVEREKGLEPSTSALAR